MWSCWLLMSGREGETTQWRREPRIAHASVHIHAAAAAIAAAGMSLFFPSLLSLYFFPPHVFSRLQRRDCLLLLTLSMSMLLLFFIFFFESWTWVVEILTSRFCSFFLVYDLNFNHYYSTNKGEIFIFNNKK